MDSATNQSMPTFQPSWLRTLVIGRNPKRTSQPSSPPATVHEGASSSPPPRPSPSPDAPRLPPPSPPLDRHHPDRCLRRRRKPQRRTSRPRRRQDPRRPVHGRSDQHHGTNQRRPDHPSRSPPPACLTVNPSPLATRALRPNSNPRPPTLIPTAQAAPAHSARTLFPTWTRQGRASGKSRSSSRTYRARPTPFQG